MFIKLQKREFTKKSNLWNCRESKLRWNLTHCWSSAPTATYAALPLSVLWLRRLLMTTITMRMVMINNTINTHRIATIRPTLLLLLSSPLPFFEESGWPFVCIQFTKICQTHVISFKLFISLAKAFFFRMVLEILMW